MARWRPTKPSLPEIRSRNPPSTSRCSALMEVTVWLMSDIEALIFLAVVALMVALAVMVAG